MDTLHGNLAAALDRAAQAGRQSAFWICAGAVLVLCAVMLIMVLRTEKPITKTQLNSRFAVAFITWQTLTLLCTETPLELYATRLSVFAVLLLAAVQTLGERVLKKRGLLLPEEARLTTAVSAAWVCPVCGRKNDRWYVSCHACGEERHFDDAPVIIAEADAVPDSDWVCPDCGAVNDRWYRVCRVCGRERPAADADGNGRKTPSSLFSLDMVYCVQI